MNKISEPRENYGGQWTQEKLNILEKYLDAYTTALKDKDFFKLMYIDAFAGTGEVKFGNSDADAQKLIDGSAVRAIKVMDRPFDSLIFVEKDVTRYSQLHNLKGEYPNRDIKIINQDANSFLQHGLSNDWAKWRGVLFLDPFATQVEWATIEKIAATNALDTWILFPLNAITRMLPVSKKPEDIHESWSKRLTLVFGDDSWRNLYERNLQGDLFGGEHFHRNPGSAGILKIYKGKLNDLFGNRFLQNSRTLKNSKNSEIFEFLFCAGNTGGIQVAQRIAKYIIEKI